MKGHNERITFHQETWHHACLVFMPLALKKRVFMKLTTFITSKTEQIYAKTLIVTERTFKIKGNITLNTLRSFAYVSSYLQTKTSA